MKNALPFVDPALRTLGVLEVERTVLHRLVGSLGNRDLAPTHRVAMALMAERTASTVVPGVGGAERRPCVSWTITPESRQNKPVAGVPRAINHPGSTDQTPGLAQCFVFVRPQ